MARTVKLQNGSEVEIEYGAYVVEVWNAGKWHPVETYPNTKEGYEQAEKKMWEIPRDYVRVQQYF